MYASSALLRHDRSDADIRSEQAPESEDEAEVTFFLAERLCTGRDGTGLDRGPGEVDLGGPLLPTYPPSESSGGLWIPDVHAKVVSFHLFCNE